MSRIRTVVFILAIGMSLLVGGTSLMPTSLYSSVTWSAVWYAIFIGLIISIIKARLWEKPLVFILHLSFFCMIAGGFLTSISSQRGILHLIPGQPADMFMEEDGTVRHLPHAVTLISFSPQYYQGMSVPKDFRSEILVADGDTMHISMNHIGRMGHYRFYQTSFDDFGGSVLTVSYDPYGISAVYLGFLLFAISGALILIRKISIHRRAAYALLLIPAASFPHTSSAVPAICEARADSLACSQVLFNGEVVPFNTVATRITYKLTGRADVGGLSSEAFIASLIQYKEEWSDVPFIKIKSDALRDKLHIAGEYSSFNSLYTPDGTYLPSMIYKGGAGELDSDILKLDEKVSLLIDLWSGELFTTLPDTSPHLRSPLSIKAEMLYNRVVPARVLFMCTIFLGMVFIILSTFRRTTRLWIAVASLAVAGIVSFAWQWCISAHFPLSTTYEMMEFTGVAVLTVASYVSYRKYSGLLVGIALLTASFLFLVAWLGFKDPVITPVMPVLASPWLSVHVSLIMIAYAILGFTFPVSIIALILPSQRERLTHLSLSLLTPGTYMLGLGIIAGAMWANVSWGRYWGWDPKETWALVTMLLYSIPLHRFFRMARRPLFCNLYLILAFASIIMTYYGVNYLPSLHAYK